MNAERLAEDGWFRAEAIASEVDLEGLRGTFERCFPAGAGRRGRENVTELDATGIAREPALALLHEQVGALMGRLSADLEFGKLWLVASDADTTASDQAPFAPHFDRRRYVKAMVYLDDVGADDGPLTLARQAPDAMEPRRRKLGPNWQVREENRVHENLEFEAATGDAGSLFVFDTNCPHFAGRVVPGARRRVLRFDYAHSDWNDDSLGGRFRRAFERRLGR